MYVHVVDDEKELLASLSVVLGLEGHRVDTFSSAQAFLSVANDIPAGCVLLDYRLSDMTGLEVQERLAGMDSDHAVVLLTGWGEVPEAVAAMRAGAIDFLQKPYHVARLNDALARAEHQVNEKRVLRARQRRLADAMGLTERELEVLRLLAAGSSSKVAAHRLAISERTIAMHRARIMKRLNVPNISAALLIVRDAGLL